MKTRPLSNILFGEGAFVREKGIQLGEEDRPRERKRERERVDRKQREKGENLGARLVPSDSVSGILSLHTSSTLHTHTSTHESLIRKKGESVYAYSRDG